MASLVSPGNSLPDFSRATSDAVAVANATLRDQESPSILERIWLGALAILLLPAYHAAIFFLRLSAGRKH
jgi:hypothetical protein